MTHVAIIEYIAKNSYNNYIRFVTNRQRTTSSVDDMLQHLNSIEDRHTDVWLDMMYKIVMKMHLLLKKTHLSQPCDNHGTRIPRLSLSPE